MWDTIGPITKRAMDGEAGYFEDLPLTLMRRGYPEATWFSFSYSPIRDETGGIGGILCTVHETTQRVHAETALRRARHGSRPPSISSMSRPTVGTRQPVQWTGMLA